MAEPISRVEGDLQGYKIVLGVTGSAAIYRSIDLARSLERMGATIRVAMTPSAVKLMSPTLFEWATGAKPVTELTGEIEHVRLAKTFDAMVIAPATLNTIAKLVHGEAENPVLAIAQAMAGLGKPVLVVPAMHASLWERCRRLIPELEEQGFQVMSPLLVEEKAKMPPVDDVAWWIEARLTRGQDMRGLTVLVTAGPTYEYIDDVRVITNPSTGLMGVSIALEAAFRGARVHLVHGPLRVAVNSYHAQVLSLHPVTTTKEMLEAVTRILSSSKVDLAFYAAAPADFTPKTRAKGKIDSRRGSLTLELVATPKIAAKAVEESPRTVHVAFAAEPYTRDEELYRAGLRKLEELGVSLVAVNSVARPGEGFGSPTNRLIVVAKGGRKWVIERMAKRLVARRLIDIALGLLAGKPSYHST